VPDPSSFEQQLAAAAKDAPLNEALAGLHRIANAAGIFAQTCQAQSIAEVCDMIAGWCQQRRAHDRAHDHAHAAGLTDADLHGLDGEDHRWHYCLTECQWLAVWPGPHRHLLRDDGTPGIVVERVPHHPATRTSAEDLRAAARIERAAPVFAARVRREADQMDAVSPAAALKARLITAPLGAGVFDAIREAAAAQIAAGGPMWHLRCSADIAQAHRFPGMLRVEVMRDWLRGRWELRGAAGQLIATSGGPDAAADD
jgi:hypothetical protein